MLHIDSYEKENVKVLGILVRYKRINLGYSLRDLGDLTNISHTLISNFERGIMIPHHETIKDIFNVLDLEFYNDNKLLDNFMSLYNKIFRHLLYHEYKEAAKIIHEIEKDRKIYENSKEVINFTIIRCLFYVLTNTFIDEKDKVLKEYKVVFKFFSDEQKQLFYFIEGLNMLNQEFYKESRDFFRLALNIGNRKLDLLINEHFVISLSKSNKFLSSIAIAKESILVYESQTNYVRAMRLRTRIAHDFVRMRRYEDAKELYKFVYEFSIKYNVKDLENRCNTRLAQIAILQKDFSLAEEFLNKVTPEYARIYYYLKFDLIVHNQNEKELIKFYNNLMSKEWVKKHQKTSNFYKLILMRYSDEYMDKKEYERILVEQIKSGVKSDDAEMIEVSTYYLTEFYKSERQYKKGFKVLEEFLQYIRLDIEL